MKILKKIVLIILITALVSALFNCMSSVFAVDESQVKTQFGGWSAGEINSNANDAATSVTTAMSIVLDIIRTACAGIALIMITIVGAKYMLSSPNERAEIKHTLVIYLVGAVVMMGASGILSIIRDFTTKSFE